MGGYYADASTLRVGGNVVCKSVDRGTDMSMEGRMFIRVVGGAALTSTAPFDYVQGAEKGAFDTSGILVEAASFAERGGWKLDTQHYLQMGPRL